MSIASLVLGVLSILTCWFPLLSSLFGIAAIWASSTAEDRGTDRDLAVAGRISGVVGICMGALVAIATSIYIWSNPDSLLIRTP